MADPIHPDYLMDPLTKREAQDITEQIDEITDTGTRDDHAVLIALAITFRQQCDIMGLDWFDALAQVIDNFPFGSVVDEPVEGAI